MQDLFADQHELMLGESPDARPARPTQGQEAGADELEGQEVGGDGQETAGGGGASSRRTKDADASTGPKPRGSLRGGKRAADALSPGSGGHDHLAGRTVPHILVEEIQDWGQF